MNVDEGQTFRNLIVGTSNRRAVECIQQSFKARRVLAPLLLLGPSGVGKSHLLQAAANRSVRRGKRVLAVRAHEFYEQYLGSIRAGTMADFRRWLRAHEVLVVDELEDLMTYDSVLAELGQLVSELITARRQIYLAATKLWPALLDALARWDADVLPIGKPSLAQRRVAVTKRGRRRLAKRKLIEIARSVATIGEAIAVVEGELLASQLATD